MIIGTFTKNSDGGFTGSVNVAGLQLAGVVFEAREKGADFTISAETNGVAYEVGAAWTKDGEYGPYLSVRLDSPVFPAAVNATMKTTATETGFHALRWERPRPTKD